MPGAIPPRNETRPLFPGLVPRLGCFRGSALVFSESRKGSDHLAFPSRLSADIQAPAFPSRDREGAQLAPPNPSRDREGAQLAPPNPNRDRQGAEFAPANPSRDRQGAQLAPPNPSRDRLPVRARTQTGQAAHYQLPFLSSREFRSQSRFGCLYLDDRCFVSGFQGAAIQPRLALRRGPRGRYAHVSRAMNRPFVFPPARRIGIITAWVWRNLSQGVTTTNTP